MVLGLTFTVMCFMHFMKKYPCSHSTKKVFLFPFSYVESFVQDYRASK